MLMKLMYNFRSSFFIMELMLQIIVWYTTTTNKIILVLCNGSSLSPLRSTNLPHCFANLRSMDLHRRFAQQIFFVAFSLTRSSSSLCKSLLNGFLLSLDLHRRFALSSLKGPSPLLLHSANLHRCFFA